MKSASFEQVSIDMAPTVIMDIARGKATKEQIIILVLRVQLSMALKRRLVHVKIKSFFQTVYLAHVIEQPNFRIPNILFVYFFIDFFVKHIFFLRQV